MEEFLDKVIHNFDNNFSTYDICTLKYEYSYDINNTNFRYNYLLI